jgi:hypothetical protein
MLWMVVFIRRFFNFFFFQLTKKIKLMKKKCFLGLLVAKFQKHLTFKRNYQVAKNTKGCSNYFQFHNISKFG